MHRHRPLPLASAAPQALESALSEARREAAGLTALRDSLTAQAASGAEDRLAPLQAGAGAGSGSGGSLALAACLLPLVQLAYFGLRVLIWLAGFMLSRGQHLPALVRQSVAPHWGPRPAKRSTQR